MESIKKYSAGLDKGIFLCYTLSKRIGEDKMRINIFELAEMQLQREKKEYNLTDIIKKARIIRKWFDTHRQATAIKIMQGETVYNYNNRIKTYAKA